MSRYRRNKIAHAAILIIRTSAIGDVVMASHLAKGVRLAFPEARIIWLAEPYVAPLLEHDPDIDSLLLWPKGRWKEMFRKRRFRELLAEALAFLKELRSHRITLAIDAQGLFRTRLMAWFSGAPERIGFDSREPGKFLMTELIRDGGDTVEMGGEYYHLLHELGVETTPLRQTLHLPPGAEEAASDALMAAGVTGDYALFAPFSTRPQKEWIDHCWVALSRSLQRESGLQVVWLGGASDSEAAQALARDGGGVSLAGKTPLAVSAAIVARSSLLVGVDTGLTHMGTSLRVPTIALFGSTFPYSETRNPSTVALYHKLPCSPCRRRPVCDGRFDCMREISVDEVMKSARLLLDGRIPG